MKKTLTRRDVLRAGAVVGTGVALGRAPPAFAGDARPNILFLLADDLRFDAVGYRNKDVLTPHLDMIASEGVRFSNAFVTTSICCTSRASIFSGTYARRHGVWDFRTSLPQSLQDSSYPTLLRKSGYRTGFFGKYGVAAGRIAKAQTAEGEDYAGFDVMENFARYYEQDDVKREHHHNDRVAERAESFIRSCSAAQPFCLSLSFKAPHANDVDDLIMGQYVAEPDLLAAYERSIFTEGPTNSDNAFQSLPEFLRTSEGRSRWQGRFSTPWLWQDSVRKYYALVTGIDRALGRVLSVLRERTLIDKTVIIFTSDNGYFLGDYGLSDKWYGYEASIRVPLMIRPVGKRPLQQEVAATALNIDLAPTMLSLAGVPIPPTMQGEDLSPLWSQPAAHERWRSDFLYEHYLSGLESYTNAERNQKARDSNGDPEAWIRDPLVAERRIPSSEGIRNERYTYLRYPRQSGIAEQLFDRLNDPNELKNIIDTAPIGLVNQMRLRTDELIAEAS